MDYTNQGMVIAIIYSFALYLIFKTIQYSRSASSTRMWVVFLILLPVFAIPLNYFIGIKSFYEFRRSRRQFNLKVYQHTRTNRSAVNLHEHHQDKKPKQSQLEPFWTACQNISHQPICKSTQTTHYCENDNILGLFLSKIESAKKFICIESYILKDDIVSSQVIDALRVKKAQGCQIFILIDDVGSYSLGKKFLRRLRLKGFEIEKFNQFSASRPHYINFRNHRKLLLIDGEIALIGGYNIGSPFIKYNLEKSQTQKKASEWADSLFELKGQSCLQLLRVFCEDWYWITGRIPEILKSEIQTAHYNHRTLPPKKNNKNIIIPCGPADDFETASLIINMSIQKATKSLLITTPYFIPDSLVKASLIQASMKGVNIVIMIPSEIPTKVLKIITSAHMYDLRRTNINFQAYEGKFLHEKLMIIDDSEVLIGSSNFDNRSLRLNFEIISVIQDFDLNATLTKHFYQRLKYCRHERYLDTSLDIFLAKTLKLFSPLL